MVIFGCILVVYPLSPTHFFSEDKRVSVPRRATTRVPAPTDAAGDHEGLCQHRPPTGDHKGPHPTSASTPAPTGAAADPRVPLAGVGEVRPWYSRRSCPGPWVAWLRPHLRLC